MMKNYIGLGICIALIALGFGGCVYLIEKGEALRIESRSKKP